MVALPKKDKDEIAELIYRTYEERESGERRPHLGGSVIGRQCSRELWYKFRWCEPTFIEGRVLRLFQTGHLEEARVVNDLRSIGCTVIEADDDGNQFRFEMHGGHFGGSFDGVLLGLPGAPKTWHLLEIKTHNDRSFKKLTEIGVREHKSEHYDQMQIYMDRAKPKLKRSLYVAKNKNTDKLFTSRIKADRPRAKAIAEKALMIIESPEPLTAISTNPKSRACLFCSSKPLCYDNAVPEPNCRTCAYSTPVTKGEGAKWKCERHDNELIPEEFQAKGCDDHVYIPPLIPYAQPYEAGDGWVKYRNSLTGNEFVNAGAGAFPAQTVAHYLSREIYASAAEALGDDAISRVKETLGGEVVG